MYYTFAQQGKEEYWQVLWNWFSPLRGNTREMKMGFIELLMLSVVDLNVISPKTQQLTTLPAHLAIMLLEREEPKCFQYFEQEFCRMRCISKERNRNINDNVVASTRCSVLSVFASRSIVYWPVSSLLSRNVKEMGAALAASWVRSLSCEDAQLMEGGNLGEARWKRASFKGDFSDLSN